MSPSVMAESERLLEDVVRWVAREVENDDSCEVGCDSWIFDDAISPDNVAADAICISCLIIGAMISVRDETETPSSTVAFPDTIDCGGDM